MRLKIRDMPTSTRMYLEGIVGVRRGGFEACRRFFQAQTCWRIWTGKDPGIDPKYLLILGLCDFRRELVGLWGSVRALG